MRRLIQVLVTALLTSLVAGAAAAKPATTHRDPSSVSVPQRPAYLSQQVSTHGQLARSAIRALRTHPHVAQVGPGQRFRVISALRDRDGSSHVRIARRYHGLPVVGGDTVVHRGPRGQWRGTSQTLRRMLRLSTHPTATHETILTRADAVSLVVDASRNRPRLAYRILTAGRRKDGTPSRRLTFVDAHSGRLLRRVQLIETVEGRGRSLYSGTVPLTVAHAGGNYVLRDDSRGAMFTNDAGNDQDSSRCTLGSSVGCAFGSTFTRTTASFGSGTTSGRASAAVDAQYGAAMTWDYYQHTFGRRGIRGDGGGGWNRVHYGHHYNNAFWDGEKMTYGDGDGKDFGPLVSLDVAGHEMTHGVTESTANLEYSGEPGALNEATSDIFGTMVEFYAENPKDPGDYLIGEQFDLRNHRGLRRMDDPGSDGRSATCWRRDLKHLDVHFGSGVGNHWFYLLAEGSGAKTITGVRYDSPTCNGAAVRGIGRTAAAQIWYRTLTTYLMSNSDFADARVASLKATRDLYGSGSAQYAAVGNAWSAVNVR